MMPCLTACALALSLIAAGNSGIHRWVDADGKVHYTQTPPPNASSEEVEVDAAAPPGAAEARARQVEQWEATLQQHREDREAQAAAEAAEQDERVARIEKCEAARQQLVPLQASLPVYRDEAGNFRARSSVDSYSGQRVYLDDKARAAEITRLRREMAEVCDRPGDARAQREATRKHYMANLCDVARRELTRVQDPEARASRGTLEQARQDVAAYCRD